jgi:hypothetical protein
MIRVLLHQVVKLPRGLHPILTRRLITNHGHIVLRSEAILVLPGDMVKATQILYLQACSFACLRYRGQPDGPHSDPASCRQYTGSNPHGAISLSAASITNGRQNWLNRKKSVFPAIVRPHMITAGRQLFWATRGQPERLQQVTTKSRTPSGKGRCFGVQDGGNTQIRDAMFEKGRNHHYWLEKSSVRSEIATSWGWNTCLTERESAGWPRTST